MADNMNKLAGKKSRSAANTLIYVGSVLGVLILINIMSNNFFGRLDLTEDKQYSLSAASKSMVQNLNKPLVIKAYFSEDLQPPYHTLKQRVKDLLDDYRAYAGNNMDIQIKSPGVNDDISDEASGFGIHPTPMQFTGKTAIEMKNVYSGIAFVYEDRQEVIPQLKPWDNMEYEFSNAIRKVTSDYRKKAIGFLGGHGELVDMEGVIEAFQHRELLGDLYDIRPINVDDGTMIPDDIDALVVLNPTKMVSERAKFEIDDFIMQGKPVAFMISTNTQDRRFPLPRANAVVSGMESLLAKYGVDLKRDLILDRVDSTQMLIPTQEGLAIANNPVAIIARDLDSDHIIVRDLGALALPFSSPLMLKTEQLEAAGITTTELIKSGANSRSRSNIQDLTPEELFKEQDGETAGPFTIAATLTGSFESAFKGRNIPAPGSTAMDNEVPSLRPEDASRQRIEKSPPNRLFVMSNGEFLIQSNRLQMESITFLKNLVDWLVADEDLISIRSRQLTRQLEPVDGETQDKLKYVNIIGLPLAFIFFGMIRYAVRRSKRQKIRDAYRTKVPTFTNRLMATPDESGMESSPGSGESDLEQTKDRNQNQEQEGN